MAEFSIPLTAEGAVTAPDDVFLFNEPSAESETFLDIGPVNVLEIPDFGWALADGVNPLRFIVRGSVLDAGAVAPSAAATLAIAGATRATAIGTWTGQPNDAETIILGRPGYSTVITFKQTLVTDGSVGDQVKIGATDDDTYTNLQKLIDGTGTHGTEYWDNYTFLGFDPPFYDSYRLEVSALDTVADTITIRYVDYGTIGNTAVAAEGVPVANFDNFAGAGTLTGGADGTGTAPAAGTYRYFWTWYRSTDGAETGRSPIASITQTSNTNIAVSGLTDCPDSTYDFIRIYRTTKNGVEFRLSGSIATGGAGTYTDNVSDADLSVAIPWNGLLHRDYGYGKPPRGWALAWWKSSLWSLGAHLAADYTNGEVAVTNGSATVSFVKAGTATALPGVSTLMVGRTFSVTGTSETYRILSVNETAATAVLDREYEGTTDAHVGFTIKDDYDACAIRRCAKFKQNQWPADDSPGRVDTNDAQGGTALLATSSRLFGFSKTSIVALTGENEESWELSKVAAGVGCVAPRMVVGVEGGGVFLSHSGIHAISPDTSVLSISSPKAPKGTIAQGIDGTIDRIEWGSIDQGYSVFDPVDRVVVFGVPLDGASVPNYEIILDLQNGLWALYKRSEWTAVCQAVMPDGSRILLSGDRHGCLWHANVGESDGFFGTEAVQTLTGTPTVRSLTVTGTPFSTSGDGEAGKPFLVLYADGSTVAFGKVASNTNNTLVPVEDLATAPAASDQVVLGGIAWQAKSGFATLQEEYNKKTLRWVTIRHAPTTRGEYFLSFAVDGGSFALSPVGTSIGDLSDTTGKIKHKTQWPGDTHAINLRGFKPGGRAIIRGGVFHVAVREDGRV